MKSLKDDPSWLHLKTYPSFIEALKSDIICFQEAKISRSHITSEIALVPGFDSYFSISKKRQGYSGTTTYTKQEVGAVDAVEGILGCLEPETTSHRLEVLTAVHDLTEQHLLRLDAEGRIVVTDHRLFVLLNIYFPAVEARVKDLISQGRGVVVAGDVNIARSSIDHCDPIQNAKDHGLTCFEDHPARHWLDSFLAPKGPLVDLYRLFHPNETGRYTCWNTYINARPANFGSRIDYILVTPDLVPWFSSCDIWSHFMGSDHAPVVAEMVDVHPITGADLSHMIGPIRNVDGKIPDPPRLCTVHWDEFSGKQIKLSSFFTKQPQPAAGFTRDDARMDSISCMSTQAPALQQTPTVNTLKRKYSPDDVKSNKYTKQRDVTSKTTSTYDSTTKQNNQKSILFFLKNPGTTSNSTASMQLVPSLTQPLQSSEQFRVDSATRNVPTTPSLDHQDSDMDAYIPAEALDAEIASEEFLIKTNTTSTVDAWSALFTKPDIPKCLHHEPCLEYKVNKPGPNHGRMFYLCARNPGATNGDGPNGTRKGKKTVTEFRCDFFAWKKGGIAIGQNKQIQQQKTTQLGLRR
ncbi:hypothetical protein SeLEV6574_g07595 [Synchytrium endobioticum]|uniref:DNA-(apurinic or apyrimidinic site) endonuclease n=1 Tax=Synchytrium endobioticum TaxID=286115 RepID=A0A507CH63_9FUNG|nr:hypothetical protein SeLEV6574_g07595 [Synchytrium endobioticum]